MPSRSLALVTLPAWIAAGCAPPPREAAYVAPTREPAAIRERPSLPAASLPGASFRLPAMGGTEVERAGLTEIPLPTPDVPLREIEADFLADAESANRASAAELERNLAAEFDAVYDRIHDLFVAQAPESGQDWARLAFLAGFPDRGPGLAPPAGSQAALEALEAATLRSKIAHDDAEFRRRVLALLEEARERRRSAQTAVAVAAEVRRDEARLAARAEAALWTEAREQFASDLPPVRFAVPAAPAAAANVGAVRAQGDAWPPAAPAGWSHAERDARLRSLFLAVKGLEPGPSPDRTPEFAAWSGRPKAGR